MIDIEEIRKAFSKSSIVISNGGVLAIYSNDAGYFGQGFEERDKEVLLSILSSCKEFRIEETRGYLKMVFVMGNTAVSDPVIYPPAHRELTLEELREIFPPKPSSVKEALSFFYGKDLTDEEEVMSGVAELLKHIAIEESGGIKKLPKRRKYDAMCGKAALFFTSINADNLYNSEPTIYFDGMCAGNLEFGKDGKFKFTNGQLKLLIDAIRSSECVDFEYTFGCGGIEISFLN